MGHRFGVFAFADTAGSTHAYFNLLESVEDELAMVS